MSGASDRYSVVAVGYPPEDNVIADALSRLESNAAVRTRASRVVSDCCSARVSVPVAVPMADAS